MHGATGGSERQIAPQKDLWRIQKDHWGLDQGGGTLDNGLEMAIFAVAGVEADHRADTGEVRLAGFALAEVDVPARTDGHAGPADGFFEDGGDVGCGHGAGTVRRGL